jgi:hypothetical protein
MGDSAHVNVITDIDEEQQAVQHRCTCQLCMPTLIPEDFPVDESTAAPIQKLPSTLPNIILEGGKIRRKLAEN